MNMVFFWIALVAMDAWAAGLLVAWLLCAAAAKSER
jgi:hypothetical protein